MMCCKNCGWLRWVTTTNTSYYCEFVGGKFLGDLSDCCQAWKPKIQTNADRIRNMTDEELAIFLSNTDGDWPPCGRRVSVSEQTDKWLEWLKEEVEDE